MPTEPLICPECQQGKHGNCDGVAGVQGSANNPIPCECITAKHPHQRAIVNSAGQPIWDSVNGYMMQVGVVLSFQELHVLPLPEPVVNGPKDEGTIWGEAFPELDEDTDWIYNYRIKPDRALLKDLSDVEVFNGTTWVPAVPLPISLGIFGIKQCHCGKYRLGKQRYMEHYAYAHILGMDN